MTVDQWIKLAEHIAWPVAVLVGLIVLPFYMRHITKLAGLVTELRELLEKKSELLQLVGKISELKEALSRAKGDMKDLSVTFEATQGSIAAADVQKRDAVPSVDAAVLLETVKDSWDTVKDAVGELVERRDVASRVKITADDVRLFKRSTGIVQTIADGLTDGNVIDRETSVLLTDLSSQFQLWSRSPNRDALLTNDGVRDFSGKAATLVKTLKKAPVS